MKEKIKKYLVESSFVKMKTAEECINEIEAATKWIIDAYQESGKLVIFGNGGSAADAQHIAGELVNYFRIPNRPMIDCLSLTTNTSVLTAIANDTSYDNIFAKQIESLVNCKDIVMGISTSGNAKNVIEGLKMAKKKGAKTILLTGKNGGKAALISDLSIKVPSTDVPKIQESHITIGHIMCEIIEYELFKEYINQNNSELREVSTSTPVRLNFGNGGDTDYYLEKIGWGCILSTTLDSHKYNCTIKKFENSEDIQVKVINTFYYEKDETKINKNYTIKDLDEESKKDLIAATIKIAYPKFKGEIIIETNVPEMSGLGGSSSLGVALINALYKMQRINKNQREIAYLAYQIERDTLGIKGGYQDQFAAAYASGFNYMEFKKVRDNDKLADVIVIPCYPNQESIKKLEESLILFYISSREISGHESHKEQEKKLEQDEKKVIELLIEKRANTLDIRDAINEGNIKKIGELLNKEYELKKQLSPKITNDYIEDIYENAIKFGAYGGKISGAGSGGCMFLICNPEKRELIINMVKSKGGIVLPCILTKAI